MLVTGGTGLVGTALLKQLRAMPDLQVFAPSRAELDLTEHHAVRDYFVEHRPSHVIHAAAKVFGLGGNVAHPGEMFYVNAAINLNVVESSRQAGVRKITALGTGCVYPAKYDGQVLQEGQIWEGPPHSSEWPYAQAKRALLAHLVAYRQQYGMEYVYAICGNLYGPNDNFDVARGHVIPSLIAKFHGARTSSGKVSVWGTGVAVRDFSFAADAARAILAAHQKLDGPVNIGSGTIVSIRQVVETLHEIVGRSVDVVWDASKPDGQPRRYYDLAKLKSAGFEPCYTLERGLRETYEWYDRNYPNVRS